LNEIERCVSWIASWTIHHANHIRQGGEVTVGGHRAPSASLSTIMTTLYYSVLRPRDRVADKPYASPIAHAIRDLAGNQTREKLENVYDRFIYG
jgi:pyruvate dehydrogenase E1 component